MFKRIRLGIEVRLGDLEEVRGSGDEAGRRLLL